MRQECAQRVPAAISLMLRKGGRGVYIVAGTDGKEHVLLSLHIKGTLEAVVGMDEAGAPQVVDMMEAAR